MTPALLRPVLSGSLLTAGLLWSVASVAASEGVDQVAPQPTHAPTASSSAPGPAAEQAQPERPTPPKSVAAPEPKRASLRFSVGLGGGSVGVAARGAADVEYWPLDNVGVGLLGALGGQSAVLGSSYSYAFIGPALTLRDSATESGFFATAAFGFMNGSYTYSSGEFLCFGSECAPREFDIRAPGVVLNAGLTGRAGSVDLGGALAVDLISARLDTPVWLNTVTLNVIVSLPL